MMKQNNYYIEAGACIFFLSLVYAWGVFNSEWGHVIITTGLLFVLVVLVLKKAIAWYFFLLFPLAVFLYSLGSENSFNLYERLAGYDKFIHFFTEFVVTLLAGYLVFTHINIDKHKPFLLFVVVCYIGITLGVIWEFIELMLAFIVPPGLGYTIFDTKTDLIADILGSLAASILCLKYMVRKSQVKA
jgi:uncharacterized membrane protein YjdF